MNIVARKKKKGVIMGIGTNPDEKLVVQKSRPLYTELWQSDLSLSEFKILDMYLSRINSHNPEDRKVVLKRGEIEKALGVTKISADDLAARFIRLGQGVKIPDPTNKKGFHLLWLLEEVIANEDEYGQWQVTLEASSKAMDYFFNIEDLGYFRYKLRCIAGITSRYSYILFMYLESNRVRKSWSVDLNELREVMRCNSERYKQFKFFNSEILKKCQKELLEKSEIRFTYEPIKRGKTVVAIQFTLETLADILPNLSEPEQLSLLDDSEMPQKEVDYGSDLADLLGSSACNDEFSPEQIRVIQDLVLQAVHTHDHIKICDYLLRKMHLMNYYSSQTPIPNRFSYLCAMIKNEIDE